MATRQLFNARTQQVEDATFTVDHNNEIVATFADGGFVKFRAGLTAPEFEALIQAHEDSNRGQIVITPEYEAALAAERQASLDLIGETSAGSPQPDNA